MTFTAVHNGEPHGFVLLRGTLMDGGGSGEAHVQAPDGSIVLLQWTNPDDIHFQLLPSTDGKYVDTSWNVDEEETLLDLFPDLRRTSGCSR